MYPRSRLAILSLLLSFTLTFLSIDSRSIQSRTEDLNTLAIFSNPSSSPSSSSNVSLDDHDDDDDEGEGLEDEDETTTDLSEYSQRNHRHQARHGSHHHSKCTRGSKRRGCRKSHKKSKSKSKLIKAVALPVITAATAHTVSMSAKNVLRAGDATYYGTGLGACGITSTDTQMIAAVSHLLFDNFPGATANPNNNPICGLKVRAIYQGAEVIVEIVDRCVGCDVFDLDFSPSAFVAIGPKDKGRLHGMEWHFM